MEYNNEKIICNYKITINRVDKNKVAILILSISKKIVRLKNDKNDTSLLLTDKISRNFIQLKAHIFLYKKSAKTLKQAN